MPLTPLSVIVYAWVAFILNERSSVQALTAHLSTGEDVYISCPPDPAFGDFSVTGPLVVFDDWHQNWATMNIEVDCGWTAEQTQGKIIVSDCTYIVEACNMLHCLASIYVYDNLNTLSIFSQVNDSYSGASIGAGAGIDYDNAVLLRKLHLQESGHLNVTLSSTDPSDGQLVFESWWCRTFWGICAGHCLANVTFAFYKLIHICFSASKQHHQSLILVYFLLVPEIFSNLIRMILGINVAVYGGGTLDHMLLRFCLTAHVAPSFTSTAALGYNFFKIYSSLSPLGWRRLRPLIRGALLCFMIFSVFDFFHIAFTLTTGQALFEADVLTTLYILIQMPIAVMFIQFGGKFLKLLVSAKLNPDEMKRRRHLCNGIKLSGVAICFNTMFFVVFAAVSQDKSFSVFMFCLSMVAFSMNIVSTLEINTLVTRSTRSPKKKQNPVHPMYKGLRFPHSSHHNTVAKVDVVSPVFDSPDGNETPRVFQGTSQGTTEGNTSNISSAGSSISIRPINIVATPAP